MTLWPVLLAVVAAHTPKPATHRPELVCTAMPRIGFADISTHALAVTLRCELTGDEVEDLYCPKVVWEMPDGTISEHEEDCPPYRCGRFELCKEVDELGTYERRWVKRVMAGAGYWQIKVRLVRGKKTLRAAAVDFEMH